MFLYLFRHGDRMHGGDEPELSTVGQAQARALKTWVENGSLPAPAELWVSPKVRAQQTFTPLAQSLGLKLHVLKELDERPRTETPLQFRMRIKDLIDRAGKKSDTIFMCSHMDWLEEAISLIPANEDLVMDGSPLWAPGAFLGLESSRTIWNVLRKGQLQSW